MCALVPGLACAVTPMSSQKNGNAHGQPVCVRQFLLQLHMPVILRMYASSNARCGDMPGAEARVRRAGLPANLGVFSWQGKSQQHQLLHGRKHGGTCMSQGIMAMAREWQY